MVKEDDHRFLLYLCETYQKLPSDRFFEEMDPYEKLWLFYAWAHKNNIEIEQMKDQAILIGAFSNLEMAKQMSKGPDYTLSDEELEASWQYVQSQPSPQALEGIKEGEPKRRRRRVID